MAVTAWAVPARPVVQTVCMADGTMQDIVLRGDESFHFYTTLDGQAVRRNESGLWEPDTRDISSRWAMARARRSGLRSMPWQRSQKLSRRLVAQTDSAQEQPKRGLLVLANFRDVRMKWGSSVNVFKQMMNAIGKPYGKNHGSVREYFRDQSYGLFDVEFDVVGPVSLSQNMEYYGADSGGEGDDIRPAQMVIEALRAVDDQVDFSLYDWDGDGEVENVFIIYAGYSQAQGAPTNTIWPHQWTLSEATGNSLTLDSVTVDTYACSSELTGTSGSTIDGIGTMCHEYSHCLGLPDFYDTNYRAFGMSYWSVLDSGCYLDDGFTPAAFTAYERWFCGWLEPMRLDSACSVPALHNLEDVPEAYIIYNDQNPNEYYMLANHQQTGWNSHAYGHGMMILHVDYNRKAWEENTVNDVSSHQRMTIIPADNRLSTNKKELKGDLWPGAADEASLTDETTPAARLFTPNTDETKFMHKPIYGITETDGIISFRFMQEQPDGVQDVSAAVPNNRTTRFDLQGRPIATSKTMNGNMPRGIYIVGGKKVFR